jgi:adenylate kinase
MAEMLRDACGHVHISTGDMLREEMRRQTALGKKVEACIERGDLVSDDLIGAIVAGRLAQPDVQTNGFLLDGFPRTLPQADMLDKTLHKLNRSLTAAVLVDANRQLLLKRLTARRICNDCGAVFNVLFSPPEKDGVCDHCGGKLVQRSDDSENTARERLDVYEKQTAPLIEFYQKKGLLIRFLCEGDKVENFNDLRRLLNV